MRKTSKARSRDPQKRDPAYKTRVRRSLRESLHLARMAEIGDFGTNPAFWQNVIRDIERALENFHG